MREDHIEQLDKMFPNGYVMIYTNPNLTFRVSVFNPLKFKILHKQWKAIQERWFLDEPESS